MIILASKSPRRKELLSKIVSDFEVCPSNFDESSIKVSNPSDLPLVLARNKGLEVSSKNRDAYIISSDTVVILNNVIYGKPKDDKDAFRMLNELNNKTHEVITAYSILLDNKVLVERKVTSLVELNFKDEDSISEYIKTGSPLDKAGAYGIQDEKYVKSILKKGSFTNVMGLPIDELKSDLINLHII